VARAFAVQPRVLLLDEPFGALDALTRAGLQDELISLWAGESETEIVLMVTHGIEEALYLADRVVVMGNPPGPSIVDVIDVPLPRPRDRAAMVDDALYRHAHERLMRTLHLERAA
jgi:ABC-type nitrate/sulfonate/bicarbonate transport system ATPase subunit